MCEDKVKVKDEEAGKDEEMEPVYDKYCRVCGVSMNAQAQAKQHYEGRSHARRLKMYVLGSHTDDVTPKVSDHFDRNSNKNKKTKSNERVKVCKLY